ncbi:MAG: S1/P1 nuclease [Chthoniobacteraceae bacterium]
MPHIYLMGNKDKHRVFKSVITICLAWLVLFTPSISWGWGPGGHMIVAQIAFDRLNPKAKAQAAKLLAIPIDPAAISAKDRDFVNAAHWADDLRPFQRFDSFKALHFIDQPFSADGTALPKLPTPNIVTALTDNVNILKTSKDPNAQAQALRFIIHFVGDIHQPLHCATRVDKLHPTGDRGGNELTIRINGKKNELHSYWDGGIGSFPKAGAHFAPPPLAQIPPAAATAMAGNPDTDPKLKLKSPFAFKTWARESFTMAKAVAYNGIQDGGTPSAAYNTKATATARQRVAWGGYRLAALLNAIWPE